MERSYRIAYFTTAAQSGRYAGMALQSEYAVGAPVLLKAINVSDEAQLSWAVDGEATTESVVRLAAGEHEVELRVTDGKYSVPHGNCGCFSGRRSDDRLREGR